MRKRSAGSPMQGPPASSLRSLSGTTLRCSFLRVRTNHSHRGQQDEQEISGQRARRIGQASRLGDHYVLSAMPKLLELLRLITLRKASGADPSFSTLTLFLTLLTISLHAG